MSTHAVIKREMLTIGEDMREFGAGVIQEPPPQEGSLPAGHRVTPLPDVIAFISYTSKKLQALEELAVQSASLESRGG